MQVAKQTGKDVVICYDPIVTGHYGFWVGDRLVVSKPVYECLVDPDTTDAAMKSLQIVLLEQWR
ncbi:hypothetical protein VF13_39020 [Nostoc linckia z16]|nr:hypothetical protein VF13_39020 [Nostoc linckia z16]